MSGAISTHRQPSISRSPPCPACSSPSTSTTSRRRSPSTPPSSAPSPTSCRPGYANFAIAEPPLKLVLIENPGKGGSVNHLGVEVEDVDTVDAELTRLAAAGFATTEERDTTCCYAKQDKFWVQGTPDGERWEVYTITDDLTGPSDVVEESREHLTGDAQPCCA